MSKQVIKGWMLDHNKVSKMTWGENDCRTSIYLNEWSTPVLYKYKGTKKDAADFDYPWPPKKATITIEVEE